MNRIELVFNASKDNISIMRNVIGVILLPYNPTISFIDEIKTITSEAITNSIVHGYLDVSDNLIKIIVELEEDEVTIHYIDNGVGIEDVDQARKPLFSTKKEDERTGLGFTIMEIFSDSMEVISRVNEGCHVIIHKKIA